MKRRLAALLLLTAALAAGGAGVATTAKQPAASASVFAVSVVIPGQTGAAAGAAIAPGAGLTSAADAFVYPADGSIVSTGALSSSAAARTDSGGTAQSVSDVLTVSLFNGEITFDSVAARASASAFGASAAGSTVKNLVVGGRPVAPTPNGRTALGDWGSLITLEQTTEQIKGATTDSRATVTVVHVVLTAEHAGLPAGSEILIGHAEAATSSPQEATATVPGPTTPVQPPKTTPAPKPTKTLPKPPEPGKSRNGIPRAKVLTAPTNIDAPLSPLGYVFPVYGPSSFVDTYGAARADVNWHHGVDIFGSLGAPLLAVADGTVFSVGWNDIGGYRFWLRDREGNQFYYAHLSAFSPLAVNGREVKAGDVIGFMGNTGDAQGTPYHVHFEIHPVALLPMGYDGVVNPTPYVAAWRRLTDVSFAAGRGWAPPVPPDANAPAPGAFLLGSTDISSASGLDPGALGRALVAPVSAEGDGALLRRG